MDLNEIQVSQAIDLAPGNEFLQFQDVLFERAGQTARFELFQLADPIKHFSLAGKEMHRSQNEIEPIPIGLDPSQTASGGCGIVIQFDSSQDLNIRKLSAQGIKYAEVNACQVPVVVRERNASDSPRAASFDPGS
jgi:hypothetical protein